MCSGNHVLAHTIAACGLDPDFAALCSDEMIDIYDFVPRSVSVFAQLLMEKENMQAWNEFILSSEEDQQSFLKSVIDDEDEEDERGILRRNRTGDNHKKNNSCSSDDDGNRTSDHPAFSPEMSFARIDERIKKILRKNRRIPIVSSLTSTLSLLFLRCCVCLLLLVRVVTVSAFL
jgi:hypothetical protein